MSNRSSHETLKQIADLARAALDAAAAGLEPSSGEGSPELSCIPKMLPSRLQLQAARTATLINPMNAPLLAAASFGGERNDLVDQPLRAAVVTTKYWGPAPRRFTVSFMEPTPADLQARILSHLNAWSKTTGMSFVATGGKGMIRISRGNGGYYSYLGTDVLLIPEHRQTMNLEGFTMNTSEKEYRRVVRHEAGHTLGFPHEHMRRELIARINPTKAYEWFAETSGWDPATVDQQVLRPLDETSLIATPPDQTSIMCYQLPGRITFDGNPILGGNDINDTDYEFAGKIYPKEVGHAAHRHAGNGPVDDWPPSQDVQPPVH